LVEDSGLDFIAIHPRRRVDHYRGTADWRIIERIRRELSIPVVGNGDVWYAQSALRMFEETNCDAVMLGRPALRNPWIFRQIGELLAGRDPFRPSGADIAQHLQRLADGLVARWKHVDTTPVGPLKEQLNYLFRAVPDRLLDKRALLRQPSLRLLLEAATEAFERLPPEALDLGASQVTASTDTAPPSHT
jgi:tRNA-dihydrouridine synthase